MIVTPAGTPAEESLVSDAPAAEPPNSRVRVIHRGEAQELLRTLGFLLDEQTFNEVFQDVDSDDDDALILEEFITCVGMLKKSVLEVRVTACNSFGP